MVRIAVIGAGIIGLSTAYVLKKFDDHLDVTIFAEKFSPETTSDVAAGIFEIDDNDEGLANTPKDQISKWTAGTFMRYKEVHKSESAPKIGIFSVSGYLLSDKDTLEIGPWSQILDNVVKLTKKQLVSFGEGIRSGYFITTFACQTSKYLPWLLARFREKDGKVVRAKINSFDELFGYDIIVNCTGVGARDLCKDQALVPLRGQVARVKAPWIRHFYHIWYTHEGTPKGTYIYPNIDSVVVGSVSRPSWDLEVSQGDYGSIMERACKFLPSLKEAELVKNWVGLRPSRPSVRLEKEDVFLKGADGKANKKVKVVHNYGHGSGGITLHWGCAQNVLELVKESLSEMAGPDSKSRL